MNNLIPNIRIIDQYKYLYVLFSKSINSYKIGKSSNVEKRMKSLYNNTPIKDSVLIMYKWHNYNEEKYIKSLLIDYATYPREKVGIVFQASSEWFISTTQVRAVIFDLYNRRLYPDLDFNPMVLPIPITTYQLSS